MKKRLLEILMLLLVPASIYAAAVPAFRTGDRVAVEVEEGSLEWIALRASGEELSEEWFAKWTTGETLLRNAGWKTLEGILPMKDRVVLEEKDGSVAIYSMASGRLVSFTFDGDKINAVAVIDC